MRKRLVLLLVLITLIISCVCADDYETNVLVSGNCESMEGWTDPNMDLWAPDTEGKPVEGEYHLWPKAGARGEDCDKESYIYQDISLDAYNSGEWIVLSGWLANYDQSPNDRSTLQIELLDSSGHIIEKDARMQRDPKWHQHNIFMQIPSGAVNARVKLIATRFVGSDNDGYFDDISLMVSKKEYSEVIITGDKDTAKQGDIINLAADNGVSKNPHDYVWSSSYSEVAKVDENGVVKFLENSNFSEREEIAIYAVDKKTNISGVYWINSKNKNSKKKENTKSFAVSFDSGGGEPEYQSITVSEGSTVDKPESNPSKEGEKFIGWYDAIGEYNFSSPVNRDIIIYAKYQKEGTSHEKSRRKDIIVDDKDYDKAIITYRKPFFEGYEDKTFKPDKTITRAEMATVFARLLNIENQAIKSDYSFDDVRGHWAEKNISNVAEYGLIVGYEDGTFKPNDTMKRAEIASIIDKYWKIQGFKPSSEHAPIKDIENHWAKLLITKLYNHRFVDLYADNSFKPNNPLKRADVAQILNRITDRELVVSPKQIFVDVNENYWGYNEVNTASMLTE